MNEKKVDYEDNNIIIELSERNYNLVDNKAKEYNVSMEYFTKMCLECGIDSNENILEKFSRLKERKFKRSLDIRKLYYVKDKKIEFDYSEVNVDMLNKTIDISLYVKKCKENKLIFKDVVSIDNTNNI